MEDAHVHLFETREAGIPQPHAHEGSFVKVGVCGEHGGERFWCCVQAVDTDGALRAIVDNDRTLFIYVDISVGRRLLQLFGAC